VPSLKSRDIEKCACPLPITAGTGVGMAVVRVAYDLPSSYQADYSVLPNGTRLKFN